jgi:hypothetical protein
MNYVDIYKTILIAIKENNCSDFSELLKVVSNEKSVLELREKISDENSIAYLSDVLVEQIDSGLVKGTYVPIKTLNSPTNLLFNIERLSPNGYMYLEEVSKPSFWGKFKAHAKENGISPTPDNITKFIANALWD